jgi:hypothetical protein
MLAIGFWGSPLRYLSCIATVGRDWMAGQLSDDQVPSSPPACLAR